jgi:hypothetical protein
MMWKAGQVIRNIESSKPFLVVHVFKNIGTEVFDLENSSTLINLGVILQRDYDKFARDVEMELIKQDTLDEVIRFEHKEIKIE